MSSGETILNALRDSVDDMTSSARGMREHEGVMAQVSDKVTLKEGIGDTWKEVTIGQIVAQAITDTTDLENNLQQLSDTYISGTPTMTGIATFIPDKVGRRISKKVLSQLAKTRQVAMQRKKDTDGLVIFQGASIALCGTGQTMASGYISAGVYQISSNTTEPGPGPYYCVMHGYQWHDLTAELTAGAGNQAIPEGWTARVLRDNFQGKIGGASGFTADNITIDGTPDAIGGVCSAKAIILIQGMNPKIEVERKAGRGGGGNIVYHHDEYIYIERGGGYWMAKITSDAATPSS